MENKNPFNVRCLSPESASTVCMADLMRQAIEILIKHLTASPPARSQTPGKFAEADSEHYEALADLCLQAAGGCSRSDAMRVIMLLMKQMEEAAWSVNAPRVPPSFHPTATDWAELRRQDAATSEAQSKNDAALRSLR